MTDDAATPEPTGAVSDAVSGNWVDRFAPALTRPYFRLSRADRPIGTWLLYLPCLWALGLAMIATHSVTWHDLWIAVSCGIGAFLMRGAGCTWNDITDRHIDAQVARTKSRPLPSGQVSVRGALIWMTAQAVVACAILLSFNGAAIIIGVLSLIPVAIYPFAKKFTWWPQAFLGIAINWGALLAWAAHTGSIGPVPILLYLAGIAWTLFYDTIYAHQDIEDDALIGVKSTARLFADQSRKWLRLFLTLTILLLGGAVIFACINRSILSLVIALGGPWALGWHLTWQLSRFDPNDNHFLVQLFRSNRNAGLIVLPFFALAMLV
ncbi:4-hydroxybenzoate octaprenyltransferase [Loktanella sp. D2R18]|uniref:4-hydroxybenzoate octaprenyltransferase n=1 Tax=Rhodobacterales TaxID=204455 RepID=UPI000DEA5558|nr:MULTISPECIES: 4-hydroxybenzoate octaprenyltransferase [Rhodobacterales]MDO6590813.1 4-hydroxybenzoate octaprenyltransferase [Yoonia sp. 1_MG-2023]RBW43248.1 4-hydroxybenzoate octaprenyltransferase [Loktanella sp. D2R18]